jgi:ABC-type nitrate/sulfonate/bicarbonate transport system substrate-binding protein
MVENGLERREFLRRTLVVGGTVLVLPSGSSVLAACGDDDEGSAADGQLTKVDFQLAWKKIAQFGGHFMALDKGYFKDEGIDANFLAGGPGIDPIADLAAGKVLIGDTDGSLLVLARDKDIPIKAFAAIFQKSPYSVMSLKDNPVTSLQDMAGKKIGLPETYRPQLTALLERAGVDPSDVTLVPVGLDPAVLATGQVDGYLGYATSQGVQLQKQGVDIETVYLADLGDKGYGNAFIATDDTLAAKKDLLVRLMRAEIKGWEFAVNHPEEMARRVTELYGKESGAKLDDEIASAKVQAPLIKGNPKGLLWIDEEIFASTIKLAMATGAVKKDISPSDLMTTDVLEAAYGA